MTKTTKKEFAWDSEVMVKELPVNEFEKRVVSITSLNGKEFICIATHKKIKDVWKPVKNATFPKALWSDLVDAISDYDLKHAFGSTTALEAPQKGRKAPKKEKKEQVATLQGNKVPMGEKLKRNENWNKLTPKQKKALIEQVQKDHDEVGMVTVGISGTAYHIVRGVSQSRAEQMVKETKGFSRAKCTFFA